MNNLDQRWDRLIAVAHCARDDAASTAAPSGFATRVAARWLEERRNGRNGAGWMAFAVPGFAVAALVAILAVISAGPRAADPSQAQELVALADPFDSDYSMFP